MEKILRYSLLVLFVSASTFGFSQTLIKISVNSALMQNIDCNLNAGVVPNNKVYMHSGVCVTGQSFCDAQIVPTGGLGWEHVSGNWGMDDNQGVMTNVGSGIWEVTMNVEAYYSNPANISAQSTPMSSGATPYMIGCVFRSSDGMIEGKDDLCGDIFIKNLQGTPQAVKSADGTPFPAVTVTKLTSLDETEYIKGAKVYPNPTADALNFTYFLKNYEDQITVKLINPLGQEVARVFEGPQVAGRHELKRDYSNLTPGVYQLVMDNGTSVIFTEKVLIAR